MVRHPIYTGLLIAVIGSVIVHGEWRGLLTLLRTDFQLEARGAIQVDGQGEMHTFLLAPAGVAVGIANEKKV